MSDVDDDDPMVDHTTITSAEPVSNDVVYDDPRYTVVIKIFDESYNALIDTGSVISLIDKKLRDQGKVHNLQRKETRPVQTADGTEITLQENYNLTIHLDNREFQHTFYYLPNVISTILLGMDFLRKVSARIIILGKELPLNTTAFNTVTNEISSEIDESEIDESEIREYIALLWPKIIKMRNCTSQMKHFRQRSVKIRRLKNGNFVIKGKGWQKTIKADDDS